MVKDPDCAGNGGVKKVVVNLRISYEITENLSKNGVDH